MLCSWWLLVLFMVVWYVTLCSLVCGGEWYLTNYVVRSLLQSRHKFIQYFLLVLCIQMPYHERADQRFVWNGHLLRELANQPELCRFCLPLLHGCILLVLSITYQHTHTHTQVHSCMHSFICSWLMFLYSMCIVKYFLIVHNSTTR